MTFDLKSARRWAEALHREKLLPGMKAVDATMGNGGDTLRLCEAVGPSGHVWAFDVQARAIENTSAKLEKAGVSERATLIQAGHEEMAEYIPESVDMIVFNLGWLPGGDKSVTTQADTTIRALDAALRLLKPEGLLTVCVYPGHPEGREELRRITQWASNLDCGRFSVMHQAYMNQPNDPPELFCVQTFRSKG